MKPHNFINNHPPNLNLVSNDAKEEAEDVGRAELQSLHGDAATPTSVADGVERRRVET